MHTSPDLHTLSEMLVFELAKVVRRPKSRLALYIARLVFGRAVRKFSQLALDLDREVGIGGVSAGARWVLPRFAVDCEVQGVEEIPPEGPLVIAANHPGPFDSVAISAHVPRPDYKVIIGDIPFFQNLPNIRTVAIFAPETNNVSGRMRVVRECIRHLHNGGSLLIFARGNIEPDPSFMPDPGVEFNLWSRSLEIFLHHVPLTRILITIVDGVIARDAFQHPITCFRNGRADKQRLAFMYQMIRQMASGQEIFGLRPHITFGELVYGKTQADVLVEVGAAARRTLQRHLVWTT
jgi:hypothetical protein